MLLGFKEWLRRLLWLIFGQTHEKQSRKAVGRVEHSNSQRKHSNVLKDVQMLPRESTNVPPFNLQTSRSSTGHIFLYFSVLSL